MRHNLALGLECSVHIAYTSDAKPSVSCSVLATRPVCVKPMQCACVLVLTRAPAMSMAPAAVDTLHFMSIKLYATPLVVRDMAAEFINFC